MFKIKGIVILGSISKSVGRNGLDQMYQVESQMNCFLK